MDRTDVSLCLSLLANSRTPYHELAAKLGLSINAVHKRIGALVELGIIRAFTAHQSLSSLGAVIVWVYGRSDAAHPSDVRIGLSSDDRTYWVSNSGGGYVYAGGYLRSIDDLSGYVAFVKKEAEIGDPTVGIVPAAGSRPTKESLRPLDHQILAALRRDSRKPATDVAAQVKASAKTVHRRLGWMLEKGLVEFTIDWYPDASNDIVSLCHIEVARGADRFEVRETVKQKYSQSVLTEVMFSNLPNLLIFFMWTNSMRQMEDLRGRLASEEGVGSVMLNVLQIGYMFETWRDKQVLESAGAEARAIA